MYKQINIEQTQNGTNPDFGSSSRVDDLTVSFI
jgi:hypothetical protein